MVIFLPKTKEKPLKITIKYSEDTLNWNNFVNNIISFLIDNEILGDIIRDEQNKCNK